MYSLTAAYYATRLEGAPAMNRGSPNIPKLTIDENRELQQLLQQRGYDVGRIDGVLGLKSRTAIREIQIKLGMPADSWPTGDCCSGCAQDGRFRQSSVARNRYRALFKTPQRE